MNGLLNQSVTSRDWKTSILLLAIAASSGWILLNPISQTVRKVSLQRFHLANSSFVVWAALQPIPSMYNFENQYEVRRPDEIDSATGDDVGGIPDTVIKSKWANHFPARIFTFGDSRKYYLEMENARSLHLTSTYRGTQWKTVFDVQSLPEGGFEMVRRERPHE